MRKTALEMVTELAAQDERVVFIGSDLGVGTMADFQQKFHDRFFMEGISEANLIGMAAGMAMEGKIPYVNTIATFISRRSFEQVCLDLGLHHLPVRLIANGGGLVYAPLGPTHEAIDDIALMRTIPNMTVLAPADAPEMRRLMPQTLTAPGPIYLRLGKGHDPIVTQEEWGFEIGKVYKARQGKDVLLFTTGICLDLCHKAAEQLAAKDIHCSIVHVPTLKPFAEQDCLALIKNHRVVITIEEHIKSGGLGTLIAEVIAEHPMPSPPRFKRIGLPDVFPDGYGKQLPLMAKLGISVETIVEAITERL